MAEFKDSVINMLDPNTACSRNNYRITEVKKACLGLTFSLKLPLEISSFKF